LDTITPILKKPFIQMLLEIENKKVTRFQPLFHPQNGYNYNDLKHYDLQDQIKLLNFAHKFGITFKEYCISVFKCSNCNYNEFDISLICTLCSSNKITKGIAIEHDKCGTIGFEHKYYKFNNKLQCPECNILINAVGVDYSIKGVYYECLECKSFLPNIDYKYKCFRCSKEHFKDDIEINELFSYTFDSIKLKKFLESNNSNLSISKELYRSSIKTDVLGTITGESGLQYTFPLIIYNYENSFSIVVDILNINDEADSGEAFVLSFIAKCSDLKISQKILISVPHLKKELKKLCANNGIQLIESISQDKAEVDLVNFVNNLFNLKIKNEVIEHKI